MKYMETGYLDYLQEKWFGKLHCFELSPETFSPQGLSIGALGKRTYKFSLLVTL